MKVVTKVKFELIKDGLNHPVVSISLGRETVFSVIYYDKEKDSNFVCVLSQEPNAQLVSVIEEE